MRLTIERLRTLILASGILLIAALVALLVIGKWKNPFSKRDIPKRLGINIQQEANGFTYTQSRGGHTLFRIHASKVIQLKKGKALLHDVRIELYGEDGSRVDRIEGDEFEYDQQAGIARAAGPVAITMSRAGQAMALASSAATAHTHKNDAGASRITAAAKTVARGEIHVKTSGLIFDQKSGTASTSQRVEFELVQGAGSATGALYDSQQGKLVMESAVDLHFERGAGPIHVQAQHAEFLRDNQQISLLDATAEYRGGVAKAQTARVQLRSDGSAEMLNLSGGISLTTATGGSLAASTGKISFDSHNRPQMGRLEGGVVFASVKKGRVVNGRAPTMDLKFGRTGLLQRAHLERGVHIRSDEETGAADRTQHTQRVWQSPIADFDFHESGKGRIELASMHGIGGVTVNGESKRWNEAAMQSKFVADEVTGIFGPASTLATLAGIGHATMEQTSATGTRQITKGDRLEAHFASEQSGEHGGMRSNAAAKSGNSLESAAVDGHVIILQIPVAKPGSTASTISATADHATYEGAGQWLHLIGSPRVENGDLQLAADRIDISQATEDAFAHGNVKATWRGGATSQNKASAVAGSSPADAVFGGQGPAHAIATEAELRQKDGQATLRGDARLWQQSDSISAPVIVVNRKLQTLTAHAASAADPVRVVLLTTGAMNTNKSAQTSSSPTVIRIRGGELKYSAAQRKAWMYGGILGNIEADTDDATTRAHEAELDLLPPDNHAGKNGAETHVDRMTARGNVVVSSRGRQGIGDQLVYFGETGRFVLTGTPAIQPRLSDPERGSVTGQTLIFNSGDDSVSIEGGTRKTVTETVTPQRKQKHD